ncbi:hypothetical protein Ddye_028862 [Dipteronia dyeriana]|uniref:Pentatricopeptide repeat-containing protein n=1 Tax=Dipteronia dyeriana TaxID=168575 RepID=A0AAD9TDC1_9ROSI|nr:hypothetical protein Ddye_028862 [Dipteronia dyeriana]
MIKAHVGGRQFAESFALYKHIRRYTGFVPDNFTFTALGKSCGSSLTILEGFELPGHVLKIGFCLDLYVSTALVNLSAKSGEMFWATKMFDEMSDRSLISWTALISGTARSGDMSRLSSKESF